MKIWVIEEIDRFRRGADLWRGSIWQVLLYMDNTFSLTKIEVVNYYSATSYRFMLTITLMRAHYDVGLALISTQR